MRNMILKKNKKSHLKKTLFFDEAVDIARYDQVKYPQIDKITDKQLGFFWRPEEVDVSKDKQDFGNLSKHEQHILFVFMLNTIFCSFYVDLFTNYFVRFYVELCLSSP